MRAFYIASSVVLLSFVVGAGCIKIQTGSQTADEAKESSEVRAKEFQVQWATRLQAAPPLEKISLVRTLMDSVAASYFRYGRSVSEQWRQGSSGRGKPIEDTEMQATVQRWNEAQKPVMKGYDAVVENGIDQIKQSGVFDERVLTKLLQLRDNFFRVCDAVFFPTGNPDSYDEKLGSLSRDNARFSSELEQEVRRFQ